jgi:S1-C subfamily serine protease
MKRIAALLVVLGAGAFASHAALAHPSRASVQTGVVVVNTNLAYENGAAAGTGIVLTSSGEVLTNNHVIRGATTIRVVVPATHRSYAARVLGYSVRSDVALLQLKNAAALATVSVGDSSNLSTGQSVTAVGNAGGSGWLTVTSGTVTGLHRTITVSDDTGTSAQLADLIETDASLQPGDSGGPLLDGSGRVIGIDSAASAGFTFRTTADGYAIPINRALAIARQIAAGRSSTLVHVGGTPFLGVQVEPGNGAMYVSGVVSGSPAAKAGVERGDFLLKVDGRIAASQTVIVGRMLAHHPGDTITIRWSDQFDRTRTATVKLASGPPQ